MNQSHVLLGSLVLLAVILSVGMALGSPLVCMSFYCFVCLFSAGGHDVWVLLNQPGPGFTVGNLYLMLVLVQGCPVSEFINIEQLEVII